MLTGQKTLLRAITRDGLERLWQFNNDVEVELAGGGDPPVPQSLARLQAEYENDIAKGGNGGGAGLENRQARSGLTDSSLR